MTFFKRLLGIKEKQVKEEKVKKSKHHPVEKSPIDDLFAKNFIKNGGKFIYCENRDELVNNYELIIQENNWQGQKIYSHNIERDDSFLSGLNIDFSDSKDANVLISNCEYLIASDGSVLVCSNQVGEDQLSDMPHNFIVYATTSQLIENLDEGLTLIKKKYGSNIPAKITSLKTFKEKKDVDYLSYGSTQKNLYLLLIEDL